MPFNSNFLIPGTPVARFFALSAPAMLLRQRSAARPAGFVEPCRPSRAARPPSGPEWIHEIKHDGFRLMVRRGGSRVRLFARGGHNWADRFPAIVEAASTIRAQSFLIDGEAVVCRDDGLSDFKALRSRRRDHDVKLIAFDLIQVQGDDLRDQKLLYRKQRLAKCSPAPGTQSSSTSTWPMTVRPCSNTPAAWALKASCRSGSTRRIAADRRRFGLSRKPAVRGRAARG